MILDLIGASRRTMIDHWQSWLLFFSAVAALNTSPGPDTVYILSRTIAHGRRVGFACSFGVCTGALVHVTAAALGLSALLAASATAFGVVKWVGAAYLAYLGARSLLSSGKAFAFDGTTIAKVTPLAAYRQGVMVDVLNPKAAIFFMAFLPQFVDRAKGHIPLQIFALGLLTVAAAIPWEAALVIGASRLTTALRRRPNVGKWLERAFGGMMIGLGLRLAAEQRT
jgi:threonine/homoserine/homoserine lactone efflux protein